MVKTTARILIIEDTASLALAYRAHLELAGHHVDSAATGAEARALLTQVGVVPWDVVLLDLQLPDCDGLELLRELPQLSTSASVIVITADGSINRAIGAMRLGAYDFLVKPLAHERLTTTCRNALERKLLQNEVRATRRSTDRQQFQGFIGKSPVMQAVYRAIESIADSRATVFVTGESGTGKEVAAEAIHRAGNRSDKPFIAINCGAIPENLLESELFGHVRGAFTGATDHRIGAARLADGGTLFLDEICEMELKLQVKLLRFLQTGSIQRVGSGAVERVDVRVVCATNRVPMDEVAAGRFREDLFYRLAVIPLELPALRERGGDVELLAKAFLDRFAGEEGKTFDAFDHDALRLLHDHPWPGNVRELQNAVRRAVIMSDGPILRRHALGVAARRVGDPAESQQWCNPAGDSNAIGGPNGQGFRGKTLDEIERIVIEAAIADAAGSVPNAASALGLSPSTLYRKRERWMTKRAA